MKGSWKIGKFAGIGVYVHPTFLLLVLWIFFVYWNLGHNLTTVVRGLVFTLAIFVCVVLHEFGHALTARRYGIETRDITLLPIGGVSSLEKMPEEPMQEFHVAVMGPVVSFGIAGVLFLVLKLTGASTLAQMNSWTTASFLQRLMMVNLVLGAFNLLPAFPMDGGRVLRALLARYVGFSRATRIAVRVGHTLAVVFGVIGLFTNPFLVLIAVFIWVGASQELVMVETKSAFAGVPVSRVTVTDVTPISASDPLSRAVELMLHGTQQDFPVIENGRFAGILSNKDLLHGLSQSGSEAPVSEFMLRKCPAIPPDASVQSALEEFQRSGCRVLAVVDQGRLLGLLTMDNLAKFMTLQSAHSREGRTVRPAGTDQRRTRDDAERWPRRIA